MQIVLFPYLYIAIRKVFDIRNEYLLIAVEDTGYHLKYIKGDNILKCGVALLEGYDVVSSKILSDYAKTLTDLLEHGPLDDIMEDLVDSIFQ